MSSRCNQELVFLHVYDCASEKSNNLQYLVFQHGVFHASVEVYGREWTFGGCGMDSLSPPGRDPNYPNHRERLCQGCTRLSEQQVFELIGNLQRKWKGRHYDLLTKNCCHFAQELLAELGVQPMPKWVNRAANDAVNEAVATAARVGITGTARAVVSRAAVLGAGELAVGAVAGPAGWAAFAGDLVGGRIGGHIGEATGGDEGKEVGEIAGSAIGAIGAGAGVGAICFGPIGAGIGAGIGALTFGVGKLVDELVHIANPNASVSVAGAASLTSLSSSK